MKPLAALQRMESESNASGAGYSAKSSRKLRVLVIAEAANPVLTSAALVAWSCSRAIMEVCDAHLVTELRNRSDILATGLPEDKVTFINSRRVQHFAWKMATWLRGGKDLGWTTYAAFTTLAYPFFERGVWRMFSNKLKNGEYDVVHRVHPLSPMTPSLLAKKLHKIGVPFILGPLNGGVPWPKEFSYLKKQEGEWMGRFRNCAKYLPGSKSTRTHAAAIIAASRTTWREIGSCHHAKTIFIPENAIEPDKFPVRKKPAPTFPLKVSFVGRLVPLKGVDMIIEAAAPLVRDGRLLLDIIGDGPERTRLQDIIDREGISLQVCLNGWVQHSELGERLSQSDVFAFPSVREFGGGAVLEAMALGLVPIVLDHGGPVELVPVQTGFVLPMTERSKIIENMRALFVRFAADPTSLEEMSCNAQRHIRQFFTWNAKAKQMLQVYEWVLGQRVEKPHWGMPVEFGG